MFLIVFLFDKNNSQKNITCSSKIISREIIFRFLHKVISISDTLFFLFKLLITFFHNFCEYYLFSVQFFYLRFHFFISHNLFPFQIRFTNYFPGNNLSTVNNIYLLSLFCSKIFPGKYFPQKKWILFHFFYWLIFTLILFFFSSFFCFFNKCYSCYFLIIL